MFFVFNKDKISAYIVSILTVAILFGTANILTNKNNDTVQTSSVSEKLLPIYNVDTKENKVAFTMNCAWNADDIDNILKILDDNNVKITFFMVGDWMDKFPEAVKKIYESGNEIGKLVRTYNDDYSVITSVNNYNGTTSVKTFDYENQTVTLTIKNSSGTIIKSITKHLKV